MISCKVYFSFVKHILSGIIRQLLYLRLKTRPYQTEKLNDTHKRVWFAGSLEHSGRLHSPLNHINMGLDLDLNQF